MSTTQPVLSIGGITPFTTIDFPNQLAAVIFCQGCAWRCGYCHNTHLLNIHAKPALSWEKVKTFLQRRQGLLDAVVFSGGEPTLQKGLPEAIQYVRYLGFKVGLHTAGFNPKSLAKILPDLDWIGFDIKAPFENYAKITGVPDSGKQPWESAKMVLKSGVPYEFRTTVHPHLLTETDLIKLVTALAKLGVQRYILQDCHITNCLEPSLRTFTQNKIIHNQHLIQTIQTLIPQTILR